jgi:hypothetical protein
MTLADALDVVVARTGHARFRELCDPSHPDHNPAYEATVFALAAAPWPPGGPPEPGSVVGRRLALVRECPDRGGVLPVSLQPECGCAELTECRRGRGRRPGRVTLDECLECVKINA